MLEAESSYFKAHKAELLEKYRGKFIVIKGNAVLGDGFENRDDALQFALKDHAPGTFMIKECTEEGDQIMRFNSRVTFSEHAEV